MTVTILLLVVFFFILANIHSIIYKLKKFFGCCHGSGGSGSGGNSNSFVLVRNPSEAIGKGFHRSGWDRVLKHLEVVGSNKGLLFDDFVEQNFCYNPNPVVYKRPWVGVFHHVPNPPYFGNINERLDVMINSPQFIESSLYLKHAICLSQHLADYLTPLFKKHRIHAKIHVIKHPTFFDFKQWDKQLFTANKNKLLLQIGFYMRNSIVINQIPDTPGFTKVRLTNSLPWVKEYNQKVIKHFRTIDLSRTYWNTAVDKTMVPPSAFDKYLTQNVVVVEYFDVSASNTLLDCICRNTPIIVNKNPAVVEYLGADYPLYFEHPDDIPGLLSKVIQAHEYLIALDKNDLHIDYFVQKVLQVINDKQTY